MTEFLIQAMNWAKALVVCRPPGQSPPCIFVETAYSHGSIFKVVHEFLKKLEDAKLARTTNWGEASIKVRASTPPADNPEQFDITILCQPDSESLKMIVDSHLIGDLLITSQGA